ncbi:formyltetrahydrofolate deformylase [Antricoccus suffuscus]|uniref:Formyltetrahydrofolate deformylase n=1 Tax=Antricoccus suffuscus TaxID=1629062 RepID=A0A2T1A707_9ACTN|nr:formyltetrahydrofolate deformylase [Antricoccus suffuscus]PRZ44395.1 formyltetrahydrofolate deformylase [Antricoccus suffuscus]
MTDRPLRPEFVMTLSCPDAPGLVFAITGFLREYGANILDLQQHSDRSSGRFFIRVQIEFLDAAPELASMRAAFASVAASYDMDYSITDAATPARTLILVSKFGHCLNDLLFRHRNGTLNIDVPVVVSNHEDMRAMVESYGIAFEHIPVTKDTKAQAEAAMFALVEKYDVELVVLARYMQILSAEASARLAGRAINIHHSFLPSFKGAKPYHQAHDRGVKIIGATAHYVSDVLDEGPIIEQDVARADHGMTPEDLVAVGRDVETQVLARAVKWHCEHRIFVNGHRTVVFR